MGLQTEDPDGIGFIHKHKLIQHHKKQRELREFEAKEAAKLVSKEDKDLVEHLRSQNVSQDVIMELTRSKVDPTRGGPEILDINALMALDQTDLTSFA